jgi:hypothetical protein
MYLIRGKQKTTPPKHAQVSVGAEWSSPLAWTLLRALLFIILRQTQRCGQDGQPFLSGLFTDARG